MPMRTYEELLAIQTELAHFNPNHDKLGRFAKSGLGRAIERHNQNKVRTDDYSRYDELRKRDPRSLTNEELEYVTKRRDLEKKARGKTPAREAAEAEMARFAVKTIGSAAVIAAAAIGANYLRKKYDITLEKVAEKAVSGAAKFTGTVAKETASAVTEAVKKSLPTVKDTAKEASKTVGKAAVDALAKVGDTEIKAVDKVKAAADKVIDAGAKTKTVGAAAKAIDAVEATGRKVGKAGQGAGKVALDAMTKVGDAEIKAVEAGKAILKKFGL